MPIRFGGDGPSTATNEFVPAVEEHAERRLYRFQVGDVPPPPPPPPGFPGSGGFAPSGPPGGGFPPGGFGPGGAVPPSFPQSGFPQGGFGSPPGSLPPPPPFRESDYNCGVVNSNADQGTFWQRTGDKLGRCWYDVREGFTGLFQPGRNRAPFGSDQNFPYFISPVTHPGILEDPRQITEFRPVFIWQHTPGASPLFAGGDNFFVNLQARWAITEYFGITLNRLGWNWTELENPTAAFQSHSGFSEIHIGPKITFLRSEQSKTVMAGGLVFEIPVGASKVFQDTGTLGLRPYFSLAQNFWGSSYGSFNFMSTFGYDFSVGNGRSDFLFSSLHLDYDIGNFRVLYPFVDLHWTRYTSQGDARPFIFEGSDLFNFGSTARTADNDLTLAFGGRYRFTDNFMIGLGLEFNLLGNGAGNHLDNYRVTADMIFRY